MNNKLIAQLEKVIPTRMTIPHEIKLLYQWIEENKLYKEYSDDIRNGFLYPEEELINSWTETEREGGTTIEFLASKEDLNSWFEGKENKEVKERLCVFAQTGAEGSECAFWLTENNEIKIVHMGSGSGSILCCVLANNGVDFLRLLAIGYDEICWDVNFPYPPNEYDRDIFIKPNLKFQNWVKTTFNVEIPKTALEIVKYPALLGDDSSEDEFFNWRQKYLH